MSVPRHPLPDASTADVETAPTVMKVPEAVRGVSSALTTIVDRPVTDRHTAIAYRAAVWSETAQCGVRWLSGLTLLSDGCTRLGSVHLRPQTNAAERLWTTVDLVPAHGCSSSR